VKGFRTFLLRGNVVDLAVGIVIGAAFTAVVTSFVKDLLTPLIGAITGGKDFAGRTFTINHVVFGWGNFLSNIISFLIVAAVVYFLVVLPVNQLMARFKTEPEPKLPTKVCGYCLSSIPEAAHKCAFCTADLT
jgi:large conductance mechanosensitive channel